MIWAVLIQKDEKLKKIEGKEQHLLGRKVSYLNVLNEQTNYAKKVIWNKVWNNTHKAMQYKQKSNVWVAAAYGN